VGSISRQYLDHVVVFNESSLRGLLNCYCTYYLEVSTPLALSKNTPEPRAFHPPDLGAVVKFPEVGGLHHLYEQRAG
jgi:putative transposase